MYIWLIKYIVYILSQISNQITFIVTSPQHKCLGEWNSYERAPDSAEKQQTIYLWTDSAKKTTDNLPMDRQCKKTTTDNLHMDRQCKKKQQQQFTYGQTVQKKTTTAIYIWTVHIYRLYRRQCAKYTYIYSVHIVYYVYIFDWVCASIHVSRIVILYIGRLKLV